MRQLAIVLAILLSLVASTATAQVRCDPCPPKLWLPLVHYTEVQP